MSVICFSFVLPPVCPPIVSAIKNKMDMFLYKVVKLTFEGLALPLKNSLPPEYFDAGAATDSMLMNLFHLHSAHSTKQINWMIVLNSGIGELKGH